MRTTLSVSHTSNAVFPILPLTSSTFHRRRSFIHLSETPLSRPIVLRASSSTSSTAPTSPFEKSDAENFSSNGFSPVQQDQFEIIEVKDRFIIPPYLSVSKSDQVFFLLTFFVATTSVAFVSLVVAAIPTLYAMGRAATSLSKLADTAREEIPSTMAAIRLSGMEISDLTLELNDLSQEIVDGVNKSAQAVQAAEAGIRQIGSRAHQQTMSMIEERANLPVISIQPVVTGAAKKTVHAVGQATKILKNLISRADFFSREDANSHEDDELQ